MNSFTYMIRSDDKYSGTNSNCQILLRGLPTEYKSFLVEVSGFYSNLDTITYLELYSDNFPFFNGYDTKSKSLHVLYSTAISMNPISMCYKINNFNGQYINFQILDETGAIFNNILVNGVATYITDWKIYLKLTGIEE